MSYTAVPVKLRTLALMNAQMVADFGTSKPLPAPQFRWFNRQLQPGEVADKVAGGTCVTVTRVSTLRPTNAGGIMNLELVRLQLTVYDLDSTVAANVANDVVNFMGTISMCTNSQLQSPPVAPNQNPNFLLNQKQGMVPNPQSPSGPVWTEILDFRCYNRTDLAIS